MLGATGLARDSNAPGDDMKITEGDVPMGGRLRLVVFDCDGTLVDSLDAICAAMGQAFTALDLPPPPRAQIQAHIGLSLHACLAGVAETAAAPVIDRLAAAYKAAFIAQRRRPDYTEPLYDGVTATLKRLEASGYLLGVATGKARRGIEATLDHHRLRRHFVTLQTPDTNPGKPDPGMLHAAMAATGATPEATVMVGDTRFDIEMARAAGVDAIGVSWGYHPPETLWAAGAGAVIDRFDALPEVLAHRMGAL